MSKSEFLQILRTARNLFVHGVRSADASLKQSFAEDQLARAAIWLTPSSVRGFSENDFPELTETARKELKRNIERFTQIASQIAATKPANQEQLAEATDCFWQILDILAPYLTTTNEFDQIRDILRTIQFPQEVITWEFELGTDSEGDPAVWIWVFVNDEAASSDRFSQIATDVRERIGEALSAAGIRRWPFVRFRTASEQLALAAESR